MKSAELDRLASELARAFNRENVSGDYCEVFAEDGFNDCLIHVCKLKVRENK